MDLSLVYFISQHLLYLVFNCGLLFLLCTSKNKIPSYNFILNLVVGSIVTILLLLSLGLDNFSIITIKGPWLCGIQAFMKRLVGAVLSLTVLGISFERVRYLPAIHSVECSFPIWKVISLTWGVGGVISFPHFYAYEFIEEPPHDNQISHSELELESESYSNSSFSGDMPASHSSSSYCRKTPLLGKVWIKFVYEGIMCISLCIVPSVYNIYALYRIKFKLKYLFPIKSLKATLGPNVYKKLKHIRLAFLYSSLFAVIWVPYGLVLVWKSYAENPHKIVTNANFKSPKRKAQRCIEGAFLTLHPVLYLYTHHHSRFNSFFKICRIRSCRQEGENDDEVMAVSTIPMETFQQTG